MSKYYCLIAGLPELSLEDGKLSYTVANFKSEIYPELSAKDKKIIDLFYLRYDNQNLLSLLKDSEAQINPLGNYSAEDILALIQTIKEEETLKKNTFPPYFPTFINLYLQQEEYQGMPQDDIASLYYAYALTCKNDFAKQWYDFNLNVNNILVATTARKYKMDVSATVVGDTPTSQAIRSSNARDFGLSSEIDYVDSLLRIAEIEDLNDRERKIDMLKWEWMEEAIFFNYFTVERVMVFLLRLEMIERWISLDKEKGNELFRQMIGHLKDGVQIPDEFKK
jgi:hypothetical protein